MFELAIYSWKRCKRLVLNKENKGKEQICLSRTEYKIHEDVILELKQEGPEAVLSIASGQNLVSDGELVSEYALGEENVFSVFTGYGQELVILVKCYCTITEVLFFYGGKTSCRCCGRQ